jgi:hypothetical protein
MIVGIQSLKIHEGAQRVPEIMVVSHVHLYIPDADRALHADGDMIGIVAYPDRHLLAAFENGALDQQGLELDGPELAIRGPDRLFSQIADIEMVYLPVQEHVEGDLIVWIEVVEIDIARIENGAQHVLYTGGYGEHPLGGNCGVRRLDETDILIGLIASFIDIPDKLIGLQGRRIDIGFISIPHFIKLIVKTSSVQA